MGAVRVQIHEKYLVTLFPDNLGNEQARRITDLRICGSRHPQVIGFNYGKAGWGLGSLHAQSRHHSSSHPFVQGAIFAFFVE